MQNFDELAEGYLGLVEKQKESEGKAVDSFSRGDMETCYVSGAQSMEQLQEGCEGTFGQAVGSLKHGFLVRRKGWNGKGMFLFLRPFDSLNDGSIIDTVKSLPWCFKEWVKAHPNDEGERGLGAGGPQRVGPHRHRPRRAVTALRGIGKRTTKAAIKREQCQTCLSIAEREQAQRMK